MGKLIDRLRGRSTQPESNRHPTDMFCQPTLDKFRAGERSEASIRWEQLTGHPYAYDMMRDTVTWADEDANIECRQCVEIAIYLQIWRRYLWGEALCGGEKPNLWHNVKSQFPEWPGFSRELKPDCVDLVIEEGRASVKTTIQEFESEEFKKEFKKLFSKS